MTALLARVADLALDLLAEAVHRFAFHAPEDPWVVVRLDEEDRDA